MEDLLIVSAPKSYPQTLIEDLMTLPKAHFTVKRTKDIGPYAGIEWAIPTVVITYLTKPFFEAFLNEGGKDVYKLVKEQVKKLIIANRENRYNLIAASQSPDKLSKKYDQSLTISLKAKLNPKLHVTVLINDNMPKLQADAMLEGMFQLLQFMYKEFNKDEYGAENPNQRPEWYYLVANMETMQWELLSERQMLTRYRNIKTEL